MPSRVSLVLLALLASTRPALAQPTVPAPTRPFELSAVVEGSAYVNGGARADFSVLALGPGRVTVGAEVLAGRCFVGCLRVYYDLLVPETGQLQPGESPNDVRPPVRLPRNPLDLFLPSLRLAYHLDFRREGLLSLTDVYGLALVGAAGARATYQEQGAPAATLHSDWTTALGAGVGARQLFGQRFFASLELRMRFADGQFAMRRGYPQSWKITAPGLALAAGMSL